MPSRRKFSCTQKWSRRSSTSSGFVLALSLFGCNDFVGFKKGFNIPFLTRNFWQLSFLAGRGISRDFSASDPRVLAAATAGKMLQTSGDDMTIEALNGSNVNIESHDINLISANLISFTTGGGTIDMGSTTSIDADYLELNATNTLTSNTGSHTTLIVGGNLLHDVAGDADTIAVGNVLLNSGTANVTLHQTGLIHMETAGDLEHSVGGNIGTTATDFTAHASNVASLKRALGVLQA